MDNNIETATSKNIFGKNIPKPVQKGTLIGAGIGAFTQSAFTYLIRPSKFLLSKDEFTRSAIENAKQLGADENALNEAVKNIDIDSSYKSYLAQVSQGMKQFKKQAVASVAKSAVIVGAIGAVIGLIVHHVKNSKAKVQQQDK